MDRTKKARELFLSGYNCSQSVFAAFCDLFGIDEETALQISAGLGGGVGRQREVCGAVSASAMVIGKIKSPIKGDDALSKKENYELVRSFSEKFKASQGSIVCREILLKRKDEKESAKPDERNESYYSKRPCLKAVEKAAEILEEMLSEGGIEE